MSPVFESAARVLAFELDQGEEISRAEYELPVICQSGHGPGRYFTGGDFLFRKVQRLREIGARVLICGAISDSVIRMINSRGIAVIGWISGDVEEVISAFIENSIYEPVFLMPGRRPGGGRHHCRRRGSRARAGNPGQGKGWKGPHNGPAG